MADPFDSLGTDQPAPPGSALGISPDAWNNLTNFGMQSIVAANARTPGGFLQYGAGAAGPLAAGYLGAENQSQQRALTRSDLAAQQSRTQGQQIQNAIQSYGIPFAQARSRIFSDPNFMNSLMGSSPTSQAGGQAAAPGGAAAPQGGGTYADSVGQFESAGKPDAQNPLWPTAAGGPLGKAQFTPDTWNQFAQENPQYFQGMSQPQIAAARANPQLSDAATNWYATKNAPILQQNGVPVTPGNLAIAHALGGAGAAGVLKFPDQTPMAQALSVTQPGAAPAILKQNPQYAQMTVGQLRQRYAGVSGAGLPPQLLGAPPTTMPAGPQTAAGGNVASDVVPQQGAPQMAQGGMSVPMGGQPGAHPQPPAPSPPALPPGQLTPEQAEAQAAQAQHQAVALQMAGMDPTPATQRAQQLQSYASQLRLQNSNYANQYSLQQTKPESIRGPGSGLLTPSGQVITQAPVERNILGPDNRKYTITLNAIDTGQPYQRPAGVPEWAPPGTLTVTPEELAPGEVEAQKEAGADAFGEKARSQYASAQGTLRAMEDMNLQFDQLNGQGPGWFNTGAGAAWRQDFAKAVNGISTSVGGQPLFDPDKVAAGEDLQKQTKLAGMQVLSSMFGGSREAASIVQSTQGAVPSVGNTPQGAQLVMNGIKEAARWQSDQHTFMTNWEVAHHGNMVGADTAFSEAHPPAMYTRRAVSMVRPFPIQSPTEMKRYMPGTRIQAPDGSVRVVPGQEDVTTDQAVLQPPPTFQQSATPQ